MLMDNLTLRALYNQETLFTLFFGTDFIRATYHVNRKKWHNTNPSILAAHIAAGHADKGKWSTYVAVHQAALGACKRPSKH